MEKQKAIMEQMKKDLENCAEYEKLISVCVENDDMESEDFDDDEEM